MTAKGSNPRSFITKRLTTDNLPSVTVPVLSSTTCVTFLACSIVVAALNTKPNFAPTPPAIRITIGTASPIAHGHEIASTEIAYVSATTTASPPDWPRTPTPTPIHTANVTVASARTAGTNHPQTQSAVSCTRARENRAPSTIPAISLIVLSPGRRVARTTSVLGPLSVPATTLSPTPFSTGRDSPVIIDSSTVLVPDTTEPSVMIAESGRTAKVSPRWRRRASRTSSCRSGKTMRAVFSWRERMEIASIARWRATALMTRPTMISVTSSVLVSKNWPVASGRPMVSKANATTE